MLTRIIGTFIASILWLSLFLSGLHVNSAPFRERLEQGFNWSDFSIVLFTWTPTNILFLSVLAGALGALCFGVIREADVLGEERPFRLRSRESLSMMGGFIIYAVYIIWTKIGNAYAFTITSEESYFRIALWLTLASFVLGFLMPMPRAKKEQQNMFP
jgi:hypothetical protein